MKKIVSLVLTLLTAVSLCACGMTNDGYVSTSPEVSAAPSAMPTVTPAPDSGSVIDDSTLTSPSPMPSDSMSSPNPTDAMNSPAPDDAQSGTSPSPSDKPMENSAK